MSWEASNVFAKVHNALFQAYSQQCVRNQQVPPPYHPPPPVLKHLSFRQLQPSSWQCGFAHLCITIPLLKSVKCVSSLHQLHSCIELEE